MTRLDLTPLLRDDLWPTPETGSCRICGCTDFDCRACITHTGEPCHWVEDDLCSACAETQSGERGMQ